MNSTLKKFLTSIGVFSFMLLMVGTGLLFASCKKHVHSFETWEVTEEATCTSEGERKSTCECGEVKVETIPMAEHDYGEWRVDVVKTCTVDGLESRECSVCHKKEQKVLTHEGHKIVVVEGKAATCDVPGMTDETHCSVCGEVLQTAEQIPALGHKYTDDSWFPIGDVVVGDVVDGQAQCNGHHRRNCQNPGCDDYEIGECVYNTTNFPATCEEEGYNIHECSICKYNFKHDEVEPLGHSFNGNVEANPGDGEHHKVYCTNKGCTAFEIKECEFVKGEHSAVTCLEDGFDPYTCKYCANRYNDITDVATGHVYADDDWEYDQDDPKHHKHSCSVCGTVETQMCGERIEIKEATCEEGGAGYRKIICPICEHEETTDVYDQLPHSFGSWTYSGETKAERKHTRECLNCHFSETFNCSGWVTEETDATCEAAGVIVEYCPTCHGGFKTDGKPATNHNFGNWFYDETNPGHHKHVCQNPNCDKSESEPCDNIMSITLQEDCEHDGNTHYKCSYCLNEYDEVRPKLGHLWIEEGLDDDANEWEIDLEAGTHTRRCKRAGCDGFETGHHTYNETNLCDACKHDGLIYEARDGYAVVYSDEKVMTAKKIIIAETYNGLYVEEIVDGISSSDKKSCAFYSNPTIETVVLTKYIKRIGAYSFTNCPKLKSVIYEGGEYALQLIGEFAFDYCPKLTEIYLPSTLEAIMQYAFNSCSSLDEITIPSSVKFIGSHAFRGTAFLRNFEKGDNYVLYANNHLIKAKTDIPGTYTIEDGTTTISVEAFKDCTLLTTIIIPKTVTRFSKDAFRGCTNLEKVIFLGTLGEWIMIEFENDYASPMSDCDHIEFKGEGGTVTIPAGATKIPAGAFKGTEITSIHIPASVTYIGEEAFENCTELNITFDDDCKFTYVGRNAFTGSKFFNETPLWENGVLYVGHCLVATNKDFTAETYDIREGTISIAPYAFMENTTLKTLTLPGELQYIGICAFKGCYALSKAKFHGNTSWFAFMEQGAGRMPTASVLAGEGGSEEAQNENMRKTAYYLTNMYTGEWKRTLKG